MGASRAYTDGLATLDLKAASDSMSIELVYELLPFDWADFLDSIRSRKAALPSGETITLEKFSSMGNGFTFELESLIFWAISSSVASLMESKEEILVYGDDIICSQFIAKEVVQALAFIGFQTNLEKSFLEGNFYESCGKHYFQGEDVTPIYQKELVCFDPETVRCGNRLLRLAYRFGNGFVAEKRLLVPWQAIWRRAGATRRFQLPFGVSGDDGWLLPATLFARRPQDVNLGISCKVMAPIRSRLPACDRSLLAWTLRRGVDTHGEPYWGSVSTSSPITTKSLLSDINESSRWVMPSGEFDLIT